MQLHEHLTEIRRHGADLAIVGNGSAYFASAFREEFALDCELLVDPDLRAYRAAGLRRGRLEALSPRMPFHALRAWLKGARQQGVQGDPWQLGGVFVVRPGDKLTYRYVSREAGDHAPVGDILAALSIEAPVVKTAEAPSSVLCWSANAVAPLLDLVVPLSFSAPGFALHKLGFDPRDLDVDLSAKRVAITGGNAGLGFATALAIADLGAEVELLCRDRERGEEAAETIRQQTGNYRVNVVVADVSNLAALSEVAAALVTRPLHVLIHNAGVLPDARIETAEHLEQAFATHVAGPHVLTRRLSPALRSAGGARVVWVSSGGMYTRRLNLEDPQWLRRPYDGVVAYAETKRMQVILAEMWAEELRNDAIVVNAMHPGWADTPGVRSSIPAFWRATRAILRTPADGADTIVWLAASDAAGRISGRFVFDRKPRLTRILPGTAETAENRADLWRLCESLATPT